MRRLVVVVGLASALIAACSSTDDGAVPPGTSTEGADAAVLGDGATDTAPSPTGVGGDASADATHADAADAADAAPVATFSGEATYYAADGTGACGFKATPNDLLVAAMNKAQYAKSLCGQCALVTGPNGSVKVRIVDLCPGCAMGDLDLSKQAFVTIAALSAGRVKIKWHFVPC